MVLTADWDWEKGLLFLWRQATNCCLSGRRRKQDQVIEHHLKHKGAIEELLTLTSILIRVFWTRYFCTISSGVFVCIIIERVSRT